MDSHPQASTTVASPAPAPFGDAGRIDALDVLRGAALLGIFLMNIEFFGRWVMTLGTGIPAGLDGMDHLAALAIHTLVQGKFWTMFSLLFGAGFALMLARAQASERPFAGLYLRRILVLGAFGLAHAFLLWPGDILFTYALGALLLMAFMRASTRLMLGLAVPLYFLPALAAVASGAGMIAWQASDPAAFASFVAEMTAGADMAADQARADAAYATGSYLEVTRQRIADFAAMLSPVMLLLTILPTVLGMFLLGASLLRSGRLSRPAEHLGFWRRVVFIALPIGLVFTGLSLRVGISFDSTTFDPRALLAMGLMLVGNPLVMLGYVAIIVLALQRPAWQRRLAVFAPAGRMALTNYLTQSLLCSLVFYGYGLGLYGQVPRAWQAVLVVGVFALQVGFSAWWLQRFRFGPMEWLWRSLTYLQRQPMRR